jgi:hypothetical protein
MRMSIYGELKGMRKGAVWSYFLVGPFFGTGVGGEKNRRILVRQLTLG